MRPLQLCTSLLLATAASALPVNDLSSRQDTPAPRLITYFQTTHDSNGNPISMLPLIQEQGIALSHLIVCSLHISAGSPIHLNDLPPSDPSFQTLWSEAKQLQQAGVRVMGMVGGAAAGSYTTATLDGDDSTFEASYAQLHDVISTYGLQGMDLDVEQSMSLAGIRRLIARLRSDFGADFLITLAPVATDLRGRGGLSGFNYDDLNGAAEGRDVNFYNTQFYNNWGSMATPSDYEDIVAHGYDPSRVVAGQVTAPANGGGFLDFPTLNQTVAALRQQYGQIGGVMGWEYFNSDPAGTSAPWQWAQEMTEILELTPRKLQITKEDADALEKAWKASGRGAQPGSRIASVDKVDYHKMVNA